ncbi:MAG: 50S ribosomal protein L32 [Nannocystaceae bacterium]
MRRANHDKRTAPSLATCSNCSELTLSHRVCPACGHYRKREIFHVSDD